MIASLALILLAQLMGQQAAESVDCAKWRSQVMRDRVRKGFQFLVGLA